MRKTPTRKKTLVINNSETMEKLHQTLMIVEKSYLKKKRRKKRVNLRKKLSKMAPQQTWMIYKAYLKKLPIAEVLGKTMTCSLN